MSKNSKDPWYKQCTFETELEGGGKLIGTAWIPEDFAKVGKPIRLSKHHELPNATWIVTHVGGRQVESFLVKHQMDYKHQRGMSDI